MLYDLNYDNVVGFKVVCYELVVFMLEYVFFDLSVFGGEGKVSLLNNFLSCFDKGNCYGIEVNFIISIVLDIGSGLLYL